MAERKQAIKATVIGTHWINLWCDAEIVEAVQAIAGVTQVTDADQTNCRTVWVDRRYDMAEVAAEIEALA